VIAPASTGRLIIRRTAVTDIDHNNKGKRSSPDVFLTREQIIVVRKLILPKIEEIPAK